MDKFTEAALWERYGFSESSTKEHLVAIAKDIGSFPQQTGTPSGYTKADIRAGIEEKFKEMLQIPAVKQEFDEQRKEAEEKSKATLARWESVGYSRDLPTDKLLAIAKQIDSFPKGTGTPAGYTLDDVRSGIEAKLERMATFPEVAESEPVPANWIEYGYTRELPLQPLLALAKHINSFPQVTGTPASYTKADIHNGIEDRLLCMAKESREVEAEAAAKVAEEDPQLGELWKEYGYSPSLASQLLKAIAKHIGSFPQVTGTPAGYTLDDVRSGIEKRLREILKERQPHPTAQPASGTTEGSKPKPTFDEKVAALWAAYGYSPKHGKKQLVAIAKHIDSFPKATGTSARYTLVDVRSGIEARLRDMAEKMDELPPIE